MSLKNALTKKSFISPKDDLVASFFEPLLKSSVRYDRGSGFFTSGSLVELSNGIMNLVSNGGTIRMISSPRFTEDDWKAISDGYDIKKKASEAMLRDLTITDEDTKDRICLLSKLIVLGILDIKIAIMRKNDAESMFHPKFGIFGDAEGNTLVFSGSMNDSLYGLRSNWEMVSIVEEHYIDQIDTPHELETVFDMLWNDEDDTVTVYELPAEVKVKFQEYSKLPCSFDSKLIELELIPKTQSLYYKCPEHIKPQEYQSKAVDKWVSNNYNGIYNMATGTGKTITAMLSLERLYNDIGGGIFTIIVCPQKHLVDQWADVVESFGVYPIIGYSDYKVGDWKSRFTGTILTANNKTNCCLITTINSFSMDDVQTWISRIKNLVLVVDEVHNMGSSSRLRKLPANAKYRLGLSATVDRYKDPTGTSQLRDYFGEECINLPISEAIGTVLTNYYYHPKICYFNDEEFAQFQGINSEIERIQLAPLLSEKRRQSLIREQQLKGILLLSRLKSKFSTLEQIVSSMASEDHMLIYCGKTRFFDEDEDEDKELQSEGVRIIDKVISMLGINGSSNIDLKLAKFTYTESPDERRRILNRFQMGDIQALVAISCLDEGVDIPSIRTAIITSSSENPKEYVQRRGRVLRKFPGKDYAVIYDLIAIPRNLDVLNDSRYSADLEMKLLCREISRIQEFAKDSINPEESQYLLDMIADSYGESTEEMLEHYWR